MRDNEMYGWISETDNIIIAFWPRDGRMNQLYGVNVMEVLKLGGSSSTSDSETDN